MELQAQTVTMITAAVDETALAADSMSSTIAAIRTDTENVAARHRRGRAGLRPLQRADRRLQVDRPSDFVSGIRRLTILRPARLHSRLERRGHEHPHHRRQPRHRRRRPSTSSARPATSRRPFDRRQRRADRRPTSPTRPRRAHLWEAALERLGGRSTCWSTMPASTKASPTMRRTTNGTPPGRAR